MQRRSFAGLLLAVCLGTFATARDYRVVVPAAQVDRAGVVVQLDLPSDAPRPLALVDEYGRQWPVQEDGENRGRAILAFQAAGEERSFRLIAAPTPGGLTIARNDGQLQVAWDEHAPVTFWTTERPRPSPDIDPLFIRGGFMHPVLSPSGVRVTDSYAKGHLHHHGIWSPWTKTRFQGRTPDFWNMGQGSGKVEVEALERTWAGPVHAGWVARHRFVDLSAPQRTVALNETWEVTVYPLPDAPRPAHMIELVSTQTCATPDPLILPEYHYGGLGYRGHEQWNGAGAAFFLTSEGITDRVKAHGTRARWCHIGGVADGRYAGTAILGHPENFRAPQPMRIHPNEPFFCFAPSQLGDWQINPGEPYVARYRFVIMDGLPDATLIEAYWQGYTQPATARVEPLSAGR